MVTELNVTQLAVFFLTLADLLPELVDLLKDGHAEPGCSG